MNEVFLSFLANIFFDLSVLLSIFLSRLKMSFQQFGLYPLFFLVSTDSYALQSTSVINVVAEYTRFLSFSVCFSSSQHILDSTVEYFHIDITQVNSWLEFQQKIFTNEIQRCHWHKIIKTMVRWWNQLVIRRRKLYLASDRFNRLLFIVPNDKQTYVTSTKTF